MVKLLLPQEIETFYVIPTLRKHLAVALKKQGMKQKDIASIFGINSAAISQYTSNKRGDKVQLTEEIHSQILTSANLIKDQGSYIREIHRLLYIIRQSKVLCDIHKQFSSVPDSCTVEKAGCHQ
mgnify:CR=1 FL=1